MQAAGWVARVSGCSPAPLAEPGLLLVLDTPDGLDLGGLAVGAPVLPVLVVSAVPLALHDVLVATVTGELVAHEAAGGGGGAVRDAIGSSDSECGIGLCSES